MGMTTSHKAHISQIERTIFANSPCRSKRHRRIGGVDPDGAELELRTLKVDEAVWGSKGEEW
jgi:hypothetical protein